MYIFHLYNRDPEKSAYIQTANLALIDNLPSQSNWVEGIEGHDAVLQNASRCEGTVLYPIPNEWVLEMFLYLFNIQY
jgi:hypothetical protein